MSTNSLAPRSDPRRNIASRFAASRMGLSDTAAAAADLLAEGDRAHAGIPNDARDLLLSEIEPDPSQPRRHFDLVELSTLADDINRRGVLQPILVRPPQEPGGRYRIIAGERRWRASSIAGKVRIPARVREMSDTDIRSAQLVENILRTELSDIEKGRALRTLYEIRKEENPKATWDDVAGEVGLGRARIHDLYHLAQLPDDVATLIQTGRLSGSHGIALQRAQEKLGDEEVIALARAAAKPEDVRLGGFGMSVAKLRALIQERINPSEPASTPKQTASAQQPPVKVSPFLQDTLTALRAGQLSQEERSLLIAALESEVPR